MKLRVGEGWDVHALVPGRRLVLGGVEIPHTAGLLGHSDADALLHAITDALLGAAGLGDIGSHFPDTDPTFKGADSAVLLAEALRAVQGTGFHHQVLYLRFVQLGVLIEQARLLEAATLARQLQSQQTARHRRQMAVHTIKEGDRGGAGITPDINERD